MKIENHEITFSSGRTKYAHGNVIGLDEENGVYGGYDDCLVDSDSIKPFQLPDEDDLTLAEQIELAEFMIGRWNEFLAKLKAK